MEKEILFTVKQDSNGLYTATAESESLSTQASSIEEVKLNAWDAVICKFDGAIMPSVAFQQAS